MSSTVSVTPSPVRAAWATSDPLLTQYYDDEWGMPVVDDRGVFERISLEAFQSGLSWLTVLRKRDDFRRAFAEFDPDSIAMFTDADVERLMRDERIIRNHAKITAIIGNARATIRMRGDGGPHLAELVWSHMPAVSPAPSTDGEVPSTSPEAVALAKELKHRGFAYVGPTTVFAMMAAIGIVDVHLVSSHRRGCSGLWAEDGTRLSRPAVRR